MDSICLYFGCTDDLKMFVSTLSNSILLDEIENEKMVSGTFAVKEIESARKIFNATLIEVSMEIS